MAKDAAFGRLVSLCAIAYSVPVRERAPELCCSTEPLVLIVPGGAQALAEPQCLNRVAGGAIDNVKLQLAALPRPVWDAALPSLRARRGWGAAVAGERRRAGPWQLRARPSGRSHGASLVLTSCSK